MGAVARVIVGASGSPGSVRALRYAEGLARSNDAVLLPVLAWEPPGRDHLGRGVPSGYLRQQWRDLAWQQLQDALVAVWGEVPCRPSVQPHVEMGRPGWVLVSLAGSGDLLVVGAGRRGALSRPARPVAHSTRPGRRALVDLACHPGDVLIVRAGRYGMLPTAAFPRVSRYCLAHAQRPSWPSRHPPSPTNSATAAWRGCSAPAADFRADPSRPAQAGGLNRQPATARRSTAL